MFYCASLVETFGQKYVITIIVILNILEIKSKLL